MNPTDAPADPQALWSCLISKIAATVSRQSFDTWFTPIAFAGCEGAALRLTVPSQDFRETLLDNFGDLLRQVAEEVFGAPRELLLAATEPAVVSQAAPIRILPVVQAAALEKGSPGYNWLIEKLWLAQAVGFLGSPPKHYKSWLAMEMAVCVASGAPCLGAFAVPAPGPVLLYAAEDPGSAVRQRLEALARHHCVELDRMPLWVITADSLRLDRSDDCQRLEATVAQYQPRLLILDPLIRLHQQDENASGPMAALLGFLRALQRKSGVAIAVIHHTGKHPARTGAGYSLRGSSDFYAWTDAFLHLHRRQGRLTLTAEHRAAPSFGPVALELVHDDDSFPHLALVDDSAAGIGESTTVSAPVNPLASRILELLSQASEPLSVANLRSRLRVRNQTLLQTLRQLCSEGSICRTQDGYVINRAT